MTIINMNVVKVMKKLLCLLYVIRFHSVIILYYMIWPRCSP